MGVASRVYAKWCKAAGLAEAGLVQGTPARLLTRDFVVPGWRWAYSGVFHDNKTWQAGESVVGVRDLSGPNWGMSRLVYTTSVVLPDDEAAAVAVLRESLARVVWDERDGLEMIRTWQRGVTPSQIAAMVVLGHMDEARAEFKSWFTPPPADADQLLWNRDSVPYFWFRDEAGPLLDADDRKGVMEILDRLAQDHADQIGYQRGSRDDDPFWP